MKEKRTARLTLYTVSPARKTTAPWVSTRRTSPPPWVAGSASREKIASWSATTWSRALMRAI